MKATNRKSINILLKFNCILFLTFILTFNCLSQDHILILVNDTNGKLEFEFPTLNLKKQEYKVSILGLNSSIYQAKINIKYSEKKTDLPDILKPLLPMPNGSIEKALLDSIKTFKLHSTTHSSIALVIKRIHEAYTFFKGFEENYRDLYAFANQVPEKTDTSQFLEFRKLAMAIRDDVSKSDFRNEIASKITEYHNNIDLLDILVSKIPVDNFDEGFILDLLYAKKLIVHLKENERFILNARDFIEIAADATPVIECGLFDVDGDYTSMEVIVIRRDITGGLDTIKMNKEYLNKSYLKCFNFSPGFFYNNLVNHDFSISSDGKDIVTEPSKRADVAIGAMVNFNYVVHPDFKLGLGFGAAISPIDGKTRLLAGPNLTFGRKNEFSITGGVAFAKLTALSSTISSDGKNYDKPLPDLITTTNTVSNNLTTNTITNTITTTTVSNSFKSVPTYNKWETGFFIGITYSLIKR